jgi:deazaflavin-dependent oxidoreductase (nitroreductase family)
VDDDLVADGKAIRLETTGRRSGSAVVVTVGFVERADGSLVVAAGDREAAWTLNLLADPACRVTLRDDTFAAHARELEGPDRNRAIRDLILRYGTPSERLGSGPAFVLQPVETPPSEASRRSR